jgi:hypothetical protein
MFGAVLPKFWCGNKIYIGIIKFKVYLCRCHEINKLNSSHHFLSTDHVKKFKVGFSGDKYIFFIFLKQGEPRNTDEPYKNPVLKKLLVGR